MTTAHRAAFWLSLALCACLLVLILSDGPHPDRVQGPDAVTTTWFSGDGDRVVVDDG